MRERMFLTIDSTVLYTHFSGETYKSNLHVFFTCHSHVVWSPKYRRKVMVQAIERRLKEMIAQICQEHQAEIAELEVMPDHLHLLVSVDPRFGIHQRKFFPLGAPGVSRIEAHIARA